MEEVKTFLNKRVNELSTTKSIVSLFKDTTDYMTDALIDTVVKEITPEAGSEMSSVSSQLATVVSQLITEVPQRVKSKTFEEDTMYSQFMGVTQQLLFSEAAADNVRSVMSLANKNMSKKVVEAQGDVARLKTLMSGFMVEFKDAVDKNPQPDKIDTKDISEKILNEVSAAKKKTLALQSRALSGLDYSKFRLDDLLSTLNSAKDVIPSGKLVSVFKDNSSDILSTVTQVMAKLEKLNTLKDQIMNFRDAFKDNIKPGDVFLNNFSQIYGMFKSIENELGFADKLDSSKALTTFANMKTKIESISGLVSLLSTKKFKTSLEDTTNQATKEMINFSETLREIPDALVPMKDIEYTAKAMVRTAERYITGTLKQKAAPMLDALETRMNTGFDIIEDTLDTFKTISNIFDPPQTADVIAYMSAIGTVAPAALDALLEGSINAFQKTMESPAMLTSAGQAIRTMKDFAAKNSGKMTTVDRNMFGVVSSYLAGEHKRAMMSLWIGNTAARRSKALTSLDLTVNTFIRPIEKLVNILGSKFNV